VNQRQVSPYPNPYDFVPLEGQPTLIPAASLALTTGLCGVIELTIRTLTPLVIHQEPGRYNRQQVYEFANLGGRPAIPATSLKGMLRSVHEVLTNSTMGLVKEREPYRGRMPPGYLPGERMAQEARSAPRLLDRQLPARITPSEALFGAVGGKGDSSVGFAGRLFIDDLVLPDHTLRRLEIWRPRGGMPKPTHESFYFEPGRRQVLGRKFYYHQDYRAAMEIYRRERARASEPRTVEAIPEGTGLTGRLRFINLREEELGDLIYALALKDQLAHKLGFGKPLGLGSVRITVDNLRVEPLGEHQIPARLLSYDEEAQLLDRTVDVTSLRDDALARWQARPQGKLSYDAFSTIARWQDRQIYVYPDYDFWQSERGRPNKMTLAAYQGRSSTYPRSTSAAPATSPPPSSAAPAGSAVPPPPSAPAAASSSAAAATGQASTGQPPAQPAEPPRPIDLRKLGTLSLSGEPALIGPDGKRYLLDTASAPREVLVALISRGRTGEELRARFSPERVRIDGRNTNVARNVEPAEEGDA
jgi:CRISPR/Cas system CSM-associated protein Csm3 (group 7 of RAMP superfamily)